MISEINKKVIKEHALEDRSKECCGLIYINGSGSLSVFKSKNISSQPENFFEIDPKDYLKISSKGNILGFYHSHFGEHANSFTDFDILNCERFKMFGVIYDIRTDSFSYYSPSGYKLPYTEREYVLGGIDCFSLVRDFYKNELNIDIKDLDTEYRLIEHKPEHPDNVGCLNILPDHFKDNGFLEVKDLKENDVILMNSDKILSPIHCSIYRGNNYILHHPFGAKSRIERIRSWHTKYTTHKFRHKSML